MICMAWAVWIRGARDIRWEAVRGEVFMKRPMTRRRAHRIGMCRMNSDMYNGMRMGSHHTEHVGYTRMREEGTVAICRMHCFMCENVNIYSRISFDDLFFRGVRDRQMKYDTLH